MSEKELIEVAYKNLLETLSYLASFKAQEKYIIGGTEKEYIVPDDLLEDFMSELEFFKFEKFPNRISWLKSITSEKGYELIEELYVSIKENNSFLEKYTHSNIADLIKNDPNWLDLREKTSQILSLCKFDIEAWEKENA